jgi:hypothetical protein
MRGRKENLNNTTERHNTVVCAFDPASPKISAFDMHEWLFEELRLQEQDITTLQIDGIKRCTPLLPKQGVKRN